MPGVKLALPRGLDDCLEHMDKRLVDSMDQEMGKPEHSCWLSLSALCQDHSLK